MLEYFNDLCLLFPEEFFIEFPDAILEELPVLLNDTPQS